MPSSEARRRAGSGGITASIETDAQRKRREAQERKKAAQDPVMQGRVLSGEWLQFTLAPSENEDDPKGIAIPTAFTIGEIVKRNAMEDLDAFAALILSEGCRVAPLDVKEQPGLLFTSAYAQYLEYALCRSTVRDCARELVRTVGRIVVDGVPSALRPRVQDVDRLAPAELTMICVWFVRRWARDLANAQEASTQKKS